MRNERFASVVREALRPVIEETPDLPDWLEIGTSGEVIRSDLSARKGWAIAAATAAIVLITAGAMMLILGPSGTIDATAPPTSGQRNDPTTTSVGSDVTASGVSVSVAAIRPAPRVDEGQPLGFGSFVTEIEEVLREEIRLAVEEAASIWGLAEPIYARVAVERAGSRYVLVSAADGGRGLVVVDAEGELGFLRYLGTSTDMVIRYTRTIDSFPFMQVIWLELPDAVAWVEFSTPERPDGTAPQRIVGDAAFIGMAKPSWNQTATITAFDATGGVVEMREVDVDGGGCSASREIPFPPDNPDIPIAVQDTRAAMTLASVLCYFVTFGDLADGPGPFFGMEADDLSEFLRSTDRRQPIMESMRSLLRSQSPTPSEDLTEYVWSGNRIELTIAEDGTWLGSRFTE